MENYAICLDVKTPVALNSHPTFDGIMSFQKFNFADISDHAAHSYLDLPFQKTDDIYHASSIILTRPTKVRTNTVYNVYERSIADILNRRGGASAIKTTTVGTIQTNTTVLSTISSTNTSYASSQAWFAFRGEFTDLVPYLVTLEGIGTGRSRGFGQIGRIRVYETKEDYSIVNKYGHLMRPVPRTFDPMAVKNLTSQQLDAYHTSYQVSRVAVKPPYTPRFGAVLGYNRIPIPRFQMENDIRFGFGLRPLSPVFWSYDRE